MTTDSIINHYHNGNITAGTAAIYLLGLLTAENVAEVMPLLPDEVYTHLLTQVTIDPSERVVLVNAPPPEAHHLSAVRRWLSQQQIAAK